MDNEEVIGRIERLICSGDGTYEWTVEINTYYYCVLHKKSLLKN